MTATDPDDNTDSNDSNTVITAADIVAPREYDPTTMGSPNETDYEFPDGWGLYTEAQRTAWFTQQRSKRRNRRIDTSPPQDATSRPADKDDIWDEWDAFD